MTAQEDRVGVVAVLEQIERLTGAGRARWRELGPDRVEVRVDKIRIQFEFSHPSLADGSTSTSDALRMSAGGVVNTWFAGSELFERATALIALGVVRRADWRTLCAQRLASLAAALSLISSRPQREPGASMRDRRRKKAKKKRP